MADFKGNVGDNQKHTHVFVSESAALGRAALNSFTADGCAKYFGVRGPRHGIWWDSSNQYFSIEDALIPGEMNNDIWTFKYLIGQEIGRTVYTTSTDQPAINWFNPETKKYEYKSLAGGISQLNLPSCQTLDLIEWNHALENNVKSKADGISKNIIDFFQWSTIARANPLTKEQAQGWITQIKSSQSGCITYKPTLWMHFALPTDIDGNFCVKEADPNMQLWLQTSKKRDNSRKIASKGAPLIVGVPTTAAGTEYSSRNTKKSDPGVLSPVVEGGVDNPTNSTAAPLKLHYCNSTGKWESGTQQMLARLLEDLPGVPINPIDVDTVATLGPAEAIDPDSPVYMAPFTVGVAMPLSVHDGNPNHFGPNFTDHDCGNNKKEKIKVVNRSGRNFKLGDMVMCSFICGEWIVMDFGADAGGFNVFNIGKWGSSKFITSNNSYFKDDDYHRYFDTMGFKGAGGNTAQDAAAENHLQTVITPTAYEKKRRNAFYLQMKHSEAATPWSSKPTFGPNVGEDLWQGSLGDAFRIHDRNGDRLNNEYEIGHRNLYPNVPLEDLPADSTNPSATEWHVKPSQGYAHSSSFDQLGLWVGGNASHNILGRTNPLFKENGLVDDDDPKHRDFHHFFGMGFPQGYRPERTSYLSTKSASMDFEMKRAGDEARSTVFDQLFSEKPATLNKKINNSDENDNLSRLGGPFANAGDVNWMQLPADVGCLASPSGSSRGLPAILYGSMWHTADWGVSALSHFRYAQEGATHGAVIGRAWDSWLAEGGSNRLTSLYDLAPVTPSQVSFMPLTAEFGGSAHRRNTGGAKHNFWDSSIKEIKTRPSLGHPFGGKFFYRNKGAGPLGTGFETAYISDTFEGTTYEFLPYASYGIVKPGQNINAPNEWMDLLVDSSNQVGIVQAKCQVTCKGGEMQFITTQSLGLPQRAVITNSTQITGFLLGSLGGGLGISGGVNTRKSPQWGRQTDSIWSFGTTALWARVFEGWPNHLTLEDPRYFAVFHFNPGELSYKYEFPTANFHLTNYTTAVVDDPIAQGLRGITTLDSTSPQYKGPDPDIKTMVDRGERYSGPWDPSNNHLHSRANLPKYERWVETRLTSVDFRVPTTASPTVTTPVSTHSGSILPLGTHVFGVGETGGGWGDATGSFAVNGSMRPMEEWRVNTIARGMLLTQGGFWFKKRTIGVPKGTTREFWFNSPPVTGGEGYKVDDVLTIGGGLGNGATIKVTQVGSVAGRTGVIYDFEVLTQGENYDSDDFLDPMYDDSATWPDQSKKYPAPPSVKTASGGSGTGASIGALVGEVVDVWKHHAGPQDVGSMKQLSLGSENGVGTGNGRAVGQRKETIDLSQHSGDGNFDLFFHFHSDSTHCWEQALSFTGGFRQYLILDLSSL